MGCAGGFIAQIMRICNAETNTIDLSGFEGSKSAGTLKITFHKEMTDESKQFTFIDQSVTGMFEKMQTLEF